MANKRKREFDTGPTNGQGLTPNQVKQSEEENTEGSEESGNKSS